MQHKKKMNGHISESLEQRPKQKCCGTAEQMFEGTKNRLRKQLAGSRNVNLITMLWWKECAPVESYVLAVESIKRRNNSQTENRNEI